MRQGWVPCARAGSACALSRPPVCLSVTNWIMWQRTDDMSAPDSGGPAASCNARSRAAKAHVSFYLPKACHLTLQLAAGPPRSGADMLLAINNCHSCCDQDRLPPTTPPELFRPGTLLSVGCQLLANALTGHLTLPAASCALVQD